MTFTLIFNIKCNFSVYSMVFQQRFGSPVTEKVLEKVTVKRTVKQARKRQFWSLLPSIPQHRTLSNLLDIYEIPQYSCYCCNQRSIDNMSLYLVTSPVLCITLVPRNKSSAYSPQKSSQQLLCFKQGEHFVFKCGKQNAIKSEHVTQ